MKAKNLLLLSLLSVPIIHTGDLFNHLNNPAVRTALGGAAGYVTAWTFKYFGANKATTLPLVDHLFMIATEEEREFMLNNLEVLGTVVGACIATNNTQYLYLLTKAAAICDLMKRILNRTLSIESLGYAIRDALIIADAHQHLSVFKSKNVPS